MIYFISSFSKQKKSLKIHIKWFNKRNKLNSTVLTNCQKQHVPLITFCIFFFSLSFSSLSYLNNFLNKLISTEQREEKGKMDLNVRDFITKEVPDWNDEVTTVARFKAFSGQRSDWQPNFIFWRNLIIKIATHFRFLLIKPSQVGFFQFSLFFFHFSFLPLFFFFLG